MNSSNDKPHSGGTSSNDSDLELAKHKDHEEPMALRTKPFIVLVASCAALGGLIFGYDIAGAGATFVMDGFQEHFGWECAADSIGCTPATEGIKDRDRGLINGLFGIGATIGAILNPTIAEKFGRRPCLALSNCVFIIGASIQTYSPEMWVMWVGRVFSGMGIGMLSMCVPVYITECAPEHVRGVLGTLWQIAVTSGILIASAANLGLKNWSNGWRLSYGGNILFSLMFLGCLLFMPESPRWLAANQKEDRLRESLAKLRYEDEIESEVKKLQEEVKEDRAVGVASWSEVFSTDNNMRWRLILGCSFQGFQQLSGINAIMFYAPDILNTFFTEDEAIYGTFGLNGINFLATFITVFTVDKYGRVKLLIVGGIIMFFGLLLNAIMSSLDQTKTVGIMVLIFASIFIIGFAFSWGPVIWLVCSEMFPYRHRGKATGLTTMTNWGFTAIVGGVFPIASSASLSGCFAFFAVMITIGTTVVYFFQVETAKKMSPEIDEAYKNHKPQLKRKVW
jgi:SP family sugar:H+ symporter-like MFS transporter